MTKPARIMPADDPIKHIDAGQVVTLFSRHFYEGAGYNEKAGKLVSTIFEGAKYLELPGKWMITQIDTSNNTINLILKEENND